MRAGDAVTESVLQSKVARSRTRATHRMSVAEARVAFMSFDRPTSAILAVCAHAVPLSGDGCCKSCASVTECVLLYPCVPVCTLEITRAAES